MIQDEHDLINAISCSMICFEKDKASCANEVFEKEFSEIKYIGVSKAELVTELKLDHEVEIVDVNLDQSKAMQSLS